MAYQWTQEEYNKRIMEQKMFQLQDKKVKGRNKDLRYRSLQDIIKRQIIDKANLNGSLVESQNLLSIPPFYLVLDNTKRAIREEDQPSENTKMSGTGDAGGPKQLTLECQASTCYYNRRDCFVLLFKDVSDTSARKMLEASNEALHRMTATMTHEMRTPLTAVLQGAELLLMDERNKKKK